MIENKHYWNNQTDLRLIIIFISIGLIFSLVGYLISINNNSCTINFYKDGKMCSKNFSIEKYDKIPVEGKNGNLIVEIDPEKGVRIASSTCPCQICVNSGWSRNDAIVCVPGAVFIQPGKIKNSNKNDVDGVTR